MDSRITTYAETTGQSVEAVLHWFGVATWDQPETSPMADVVLTLMGTPDHVAEVMARAEYHTVTVAPDHGPVIAPITLEMWLALRNHLKPVPEKPTPLSFHPRAKHEPVGETPATGVSPVFSIPADLF